MRCAYGGEVTFTACEPGYRLRLYNGSTISVILSKEDVVKLQQRVQEILEEEEEEGSSDDP